jgi:carboxymethylenebutenolidase
MAQRLADAGYVVAVRTSITAPAPFAPFDPALGAAGGRERDRFMAMIRSINGDLVMQDTAAVLAHLDTRPSVAPARSARWATAWAAATRCAPRASFPTACRGRRRSTAGRSPPTGPTARISWLDGCAPALRGRGRHRPGFTDEQRQRLDAALRDGGVDYEIEIYDGAQHGFAVHNHRVYDRAASERHWERLLAAVRRRAARGARGISLAPSARAGALPRRGDE